MHSGRDAFCPQITPTSQRSQISSIEKHCSPACRESLAKGNQFSVSSLQTLLNGIQAREVTLAQKAASSDRRVYFVMRSRLSVAGRGCRNWPTFYVWAERKVNTTEVLWELLYYIRFCEGGPRVIQRPRILFSLFQESTAFCWRGLLDRLFVVNGRQVKELSSSVFTVPENYATGRGQGLAL